MLNRSSSCSRIHVATQLDVDYVDPLPPLIGTSTGSRGYWSPRAADGSVGAAAHCVADGDSSLPILPFGRGCVGSGPALACLRWGMGSFARGGARAGDFRCPGRRAWRA